MKDDIETRITERTRIAHNHLREQGMFARAFNRAGLAMANGMDRITGWMYDDRTVFMGATAGGLWRGATFGLIATVLLAAAFPLNALAVPLLFTLMAAGAIGCGIYDGQHLLERHLTRKSVRLSDDIATSFGAVPKTHVHITHSPEETLIESGRNPQALEARVNATLREQAQAKSFATREDTRRVEPLPPQR